MTKKAKYCLSCTKPVCDNCLDKKKNIYRTPEQNREACKLYYQRHKEKCMERTKRNRLKKRMAERGAEMAIYI